MDLPGRLKLAREAAGYGNASQFARSIGVTPNSVYRYERGDQTPSLAIAGRWAERCAVSLDWLQRGEGKGPATKGPLEATGTGG